MAPDDFTDYVATRWQRLVRSAVLLGCDAAEAEDVVQSALERCLRRWGRVQDAHDRDAYVHRVLINTFTSARRRRWTGERPRAVLPDRPEDAVDDGTHRVDDVDAVRRALARLPDGQREVVVLRFYARLTEAQVAAALGVAPGTVKSRQSRALRALAADPDLDLLRGTS